MEQYYLAVDIGASSGRHILGHVTNGIMELEEVYRFANGLTKKDGALVWDIDELFRQIKAGMKKCKEIGKIPVSMGIDTWAVDFVLLDKDGKRIGDAVGYRDSRTEGMDEKVYEQVPEEELYARTGIQKQIFNTIYQLMAVKQKSPQQMEEAETMLLVPDYFHYLLTGVKAAEYTNATTTQLVNPDTNDWDMELIEKLGYPARLFQNILKPGSELGTLTKEIQEEVGFDCKVILPATHDTGSAVAAIPTEEDDALYISSGTWSLMGTERKKADCSPQSKAHNMTNEGGYDYRFRYLKNIMGLWMIQNVKKEIGGDFGFGEICDQASQASITSLVDCNDQRFLAPENMTKEVQKACEESGQQVPQGIAEVAAVIYQSLANCYKNTLVELESLTGKKYDKIHVIGGGANAEYLNRLTANVTGVPISAGPTEATAVGNLAAQMISCGEFTGLKAARACIYQSLPIKTYTPDK